MAVFFKISSQKMLVQSRCDEEIYDQLLLRVCLKLSWGVSLVVMTWVSANFGNWVHPAGGETSFQLADLTTWILTQKNLGSFNQCPTGYTPNSCFWPSTMIRIQKFGFQKIIEIDSKIQNALPKGPDCLESTILKITGKISVVITACYVGK